MGVLCKTPHDDLRDALIDLADVAQEIDQSGRGVSYVTLCLDGDKPFGPTLMVTQDVFDTLVLSEQAEPDSRISDLGAYDHTDGTWFATCLYRGVHISAHGYPTRPEWGAAGPAEVTRA